LKIYPYEGNIIHGEGNIIYKHIDSEEHYHNKKEFNLECGICNFIKYINLLYFNYRTISFFKDIIDISFQNLLDQ